MRINFTESTLNALKLTANCSYANAVYNLTMKAQQGLKCDDIYKKSVLMHEVNKLLCKYNLSKTVYFNSTYSNLFVVVNGFGILFNVFIGGEQVATNLNRHELYYYLISLGWRDNTNLGPDNTFFLQIPAYLLAQYSNLQDVTITEPNDIIYITINDESSSIRSAIILGSYTAVDYTEEQLNCITPDNLQALYEFTNKYKQTASRSSKKITAPNTNNNNNNTNSTGDCCTWGSITGSIGNQSDLVNYLATLDDKISIKDEGILINNDVKTINFVGDGVNATNNGSEVTVTIPGGGSGGDNIYNGPSPSTVVVQNFPIGTNIFGMTYDELFGNIYAPYVSPAFSTFSMNQISPVEVGYTITPSTKQFSWAFTNTNLQVNSVSITDATTSTVLLSGLSNTSPASVNIGTIQKTSPSSHSWQASAINSNSISFSSGLYTVNWYWKVYTGISANVTLTAVQIQSLVNANLQAGKNGTYNLPATNYKYFCWPDSMGSPAAVTGFKDAGSNLNIAMADSTDNIFYSNTQNGWSYGLVSVTNTYGQTTNYRVYRSKNLLGNSIQAIVS